MNLLRRSCTKLYFLLLSLLISINSLGQQKNIYYKAFNYLKSKNKGKELTVSDTVIHFYLANFTEQLSLEWKKSKSETENMLDSVDWKQEGYQQQFNELKNLSSKGGKPRQVIFFSNICKNVLVVEIMDQKENRNMSHYSQSMFNKSTQYLFIFDNKNNITKVFQHDVQYN